MEASTINVLAMTICLGFCAYSIRLLARRRHTFLQTTLATFVGLVFGLTLGVVVEYRDLIFGAQAFGDIQVELMRIFFPKSGKWIGVTFFAMVGMLSGWLTLEISMVRSNAAKGL